MCSSIRVTSKPMLALRGSFGVCTNANHFGIRVPENTQPMRCVNAISTAPENIELESFLSATRCTIASSSICTPKKQE